MDDLSYLLDKIGSYNIQGIKKILLAYEFASYQHRNQQRESGEPYITHPLAVAIILAELHADIDTICAALLHDVIEDTQTEASAIEEIFGKSVETLVMGVTDLTQMNFYDKTELDYANIRKLLLGMTKDIRIILIKLADRLHNMRTLEYKKDPNKQIAKAMETMEIYVPLAKSLGLYALKTELEDLCFSYLKPDKYLRLKDTINQIELEAEVYKAAIIQQIKRILEDNMIPSEIKFQMKGVYGIFKSLSEGKSLENIPDLLVYRILLKRVDDCYLSLRHIHTLYPPVNRFMRDYIANPKGSHQALHTTVIGPDAKFMQMKIQTLEMEMKSNYGIINYWFTNGELGTLYMQQSICKEYPFVNSIEHINKTADSNTDFIERIKGEVFSKKIIVFDESGKSVEIPAGSTPIDFAYYIHSDIGDKMVGAIVDGNPVEINHPLEDKNHVRIITSEKSLGPDEKWLYMARTRRATKKIKEALNKKRKAFS